MRITAIVVEILVGALCDGVFHFGSPTRVRDLGLSFNVDVKQDMPRPAVGGAYFLPSRPGELGERLFQSRHIRNAFSLNMGRNVGVTPLLP